MACVLNNQTCRLITVYYYRDMNLTGIHHDQVHVVPSSMPTTYIQVYVNAACTGCTFFFFFSTDITLIATYTI